MRFANLSRLFDTAVDKKLASLWILAGLTAPNDSDDDATARGALNDPSPLCFKPCPVTAADPPVLRPTTGADREDDVSALAHCAMRARLVSSIPKLMLCSMVVR